MEAAGKVKYDPKRTCGVCAENQPARPEIVRYVGEAYFCPVHEVYVRPYEPACSHFKEPNQPCRT